MQPEDLATTIRTGESQSVEFKADFSPEVGKSICAFANTNAGAVFVGIKDDGTIRGISTDVEEQVAQVAHSCKPSVYPEITKINCEGKLILLVAVPQSKGALHSYKHIAYKRIGTNDMPLSPEEVITLAKQARIIRFDNQFCNASLADIDEAMIRKFIRSAVAERRLEIDPALPIAEFLEKLELQQENNLTHAAVLLFGKAPQGFALQSEVRCARFKGVDTLRFIDMKVLRGNVIDLIDNAEKFVMNHIRLAAEVVDFLREEKWEYPLVAIREAITNAICHRDYFSTANVHISIFDDRLEVWNPGTLPPELSLEQLKKSHKSIPQGGGALGELE